MNHKQDTGREHVEAQIDWVLRNQGTSVWLKTTLEDALKGDPIAVGNDAEVLHHLLRARAQILVRGQLENATTAHRPA